MVGSGIIPMFLSAQGMTADTCPLGEKRERPRRILIARSGGSPELSRVVRRLAFEFAGKEARSKIYKIPGAGDAPRVTDVSGYDAIFIGVAPDGTCATDAAFTFMRSHMDDLAAKPVALFFLLDRAPKLSSAAHSPELTFEGLSRMSPLDVMTFTRSGQGMADAVSDWAGNKIWPLMETGWLADMLFPCPVPYAGMKTAG